MKRILAIVLVSLAGQMLLSATASAKNGDFGLGIILGEPTGVSGKFWISANSAIDGAAAWSLGNNDAFHLHGDYLRHNFSLIKVEKGRLPFYYGIGGRIRFADNGGDDFIGVRIPVGLAYLFEKAPLDIFLEIVPILDLAPDTDFDLNAALGMRYFF